MDTILTLAVVACAVLYLGRRAWRAMTGTPCGCGAAKGGCPAASSLAEDLAAIGKDATTR